MGKNFKFSVTLKDNPTIHFYILKLSLKFVSISIDQFKLSVYDLLSFVIPNKNN